MGTQELKAVKSGSWSPLKVFNQRLDLVETQSQI